MILDEDTQEFEKENSGNPFPVTFPPWYKANVKESAILEKENFSALTSSQIIETAFEKIASHLPGYEQRDSQVKMAKKILETLLTDKSGVIEAATGVGKSFAYLIAALAYSYLRGERVVITTETRNLQAQLFTKDLPFLHNTLDKSLTFELALGSGNYLCRLRYNDAIDRGSFRDLVDNSGLDEIKEWAKTVFNSSTLHGHVYEECPEIPGIFWSDISRDPDACPAMKCEFFSKCNYYRARKAWSESRLIVANHHLVLYHMLNEKRTLPSYSSIVIDEAHGFLKSGYSIFTLSFSRDFLAEQKKKWDRMLKNLPETGPEQKMEFDEKWRLAQSKWESYFQHAEVETNLAFEENTSRIIGKAFPHKNEFSVPLADITEAINALLEEIDDSSRTNSISSLVKGLKRAITFGKAFETPDFNKMVYWGEKNRERFSLLCCNLNLGEELSPMMNEQQIWTSATIGYWPSGTIPKMKSELLNGGYFKTFVKEAIPATPANALVQDIYFSPFKYRERAALYIPENLIAPEYGSDKSRSDAYLDKLAREILGLIELSQGGALVLFTSNHILSRMTEILREESDLTVFSQLEDGANKALEYFRADKNSVLLGTNSFWQGVDVPGQGLRMLIITKLMFMPPDDPIFKARSDMLEKKGGKPFFELALPYAVTMLRQAFGRLIRGESDSGVVAILDSRIWHKSYGKMLIANLPRTEVFKNLTELRKFTKELNLL